MSSFPPNYASLHQRALGASPIPDVDGIHKDLQTSGISASQQRIKRAATRAAAFNQEDADIAQNVSLTMDSSADATLTRIYSSVAGANPLLNRTLFQVTRMTGGRPTFTEDGTNRIVFPSASIAPSTSGANLSSNLLSTPSYNAWGWEVETVTDAAKVQFRLAGNTVSGIRVTVDGRYVSKAALNYANTNSQNYPTLIFPDRRPRVIRLEGAGGSGQLVSLAVAPTANCARSEGPLDRVLALCTGDSYSEGIGASIPGLFAWTKALGRRMGWSDTRIVAVGQTGYLSNSSGNRKPIRRQIADWPVVNADINMSDVDVVCVAGGFNDYSQANVLTLLQAEVVATIQAIRAMCPNAMIVIFGSHAGARGPDAQTLNVEALVQAGFAQAGDERSYYVPLAADASPWTFGTGYVGTPNNSGNSDVAIAADGSHPSDLGHSIYSVRAAIALRSILSGVG